MKRRHSRSLNVETDLHISILHFLADELVTITASNPSLLSPNQQIDAVTPDTQVTVI